MKIVSCDICGNTIDENTRFPRLPEIRFELGKTDKGEPRMCRLREPTGGNSYECCFVTTGLDFCPACILKAFQKAVAALEPPGIRL